MGLEVWQRLGEIFLYHGKYVVKLLERFGKVEWKSLATLMEMKFKKLCGDFVVTNLENPYEYWQSIGALMFLVKTHPNTCFVVNILIQFMTEPLHEHWVVAKHMLRYLSGTFNLGMIYNAKDVRLHGYIDVDWAWNVIDKKSTSRCWFSLGSAMISWMSRKKKFMNLSKVEANYIVASMDRCQVVWLRKLFGELFEQVLGTTVIYCDNKSGIWLAESIVLHEKSKHIKIKYQYIWDMV